MSNYGGKNTRHFSGTEHVRCRPKMYVGGTDKRGIHHLLHEIVNNAIEVAMMRQYGHIEIILQDNQTVQVIDDSGGLSLETFRDDMPINAELIMTNFAGGSYPDHPMPVVGGYHGVGLAPVNALCERMTLDIRQNGVVWRQQYQQGVPISPFSIVKDVDAGKTNGNTFTFRPDYDIFEPCEFDFDRIAERYQEAAYAVHGLEIVLRDERKIPHREAVFSEENGVLSLLNKRRGDAAALHEPNLLTQEYPFQQWPSQPIRNVEVELALQLTHEAQFYVEGFVNSRSIEWGGVHFDGIMRAFLDYLDKGKLSANISPGLIAIINIRHPNPQFESQKVLRLINADVEDTMYKLTLKALDEALTSMQN